MTPEEALIDQYVCDGSIMLARLGDHLVTLDALRDSHKHDSLAHFGLTADTAAYEGNLRQLVSAHIDRYDTHMGAYLRYAHVVLTYMVLEDRLHAFGQLIAATHRGSAFTPEKSNAKGSLLVKFEHYLSSLSLSAPPAAAVEALRLIRNCIVHCRGCLTDFGKRDRGKLQRYLPHLPGVTVDPRQHLALTTEACLSLQEGVIQYLQDVDSAAGFHMWLPPEVRKNFEQHILPHLKKPEPPAT